MGKGKKQKKAVDQNDPEALKVNYLKTNFFTRILETNNN
jgi:hypothetical protein